MVTSDRVRTQRDGQTYSLTFDDVTDADSGYYACYISNDAGEDKCSAELLVEGKVDR